MIQSFSIYFHKKRINLYKKHGSERRLTMKVNNGKSLGFIDFGL